ncbi:MAG TPA: hypothetical protein P5348_03885, partial [Bacteroidales bacterium]|nr:hypothetical protein [Bacteroidales bacterium]
MKPKLFLLPLVFLFLCGCSENKKENLPENNIAVVATASWSGRPGSSLIALNDGLTLNPGEQRSRPPVVSLRPGTPWVQYEWDRDIKTGKMEIFWWADRSRVKLPSGCKVKYWDGSDFTEVKNQSGPEFREGVFNPVTFDEISTSKIRLEIETDSASPAAILEWTVPASPSSPALPAMVSAGDDRSVMIDGKTYLSARVKSAYPVKKSSWKVVSGPGRVSFANPSSASTTATFGKTGEYLLSYDVITKGGLSSSSLKVKVIDPPPARRLEVVYTNRYKINSPLWSARAKAIIVNWIPHCIRQIERTDLKTGQGGLDNFIEAAKALRGEPHGKHVGYVFSNAWVHQTIESMCIALMIDPQGDREIIAAQDLMKKTLEKWIPIVLAAQEP